LAAIRSVGEAVTHDRQVRGARGLVGALRDRQGAGGELDRIELLLGGCGSDGRARDDRRGAGQKSGSEHERDAGTEHLRRGNRRLVLQLEGIS
jgi:hypothetical protein